MRQICYVQGRRGEILSQFEATEIEGSPPPPSWNVTLTRNVPIIAERVDDDSIDRRLLIARWDLVATWANDIKIVSRLINARRESVPDKPSLRKGSRQTPGPGPGGGYY